MGTVKKGVCELCAKSEPEHGALYFGIRGHDPLWFKHFDCACEFIRGVIEDRIPYHKMTGGKEPVKKVVET